MELIVEIFCYRIRQIKTFIQERESEKKHNLILMKLYSQPYFLILLKAFKKFLQLTGNLKVVFCFANFVDRMTCVSSFVMFRHNLVDGKNVFSSYLCYSHSLMRILVAYLSWLPFVTMLGGRNVNSLSIFVPGNCRSWRCMNYTNKL